MAILFLIVGGKKYSYQKDKGLLGSKNLSYTRRQTIKNIGCIPLLYRTLAVPTLSRFFFQ